MQDKLDNQLAHHFANYTTYKNLDWLRFPHLFFHTSEIPFLRLQLHWDHLDIVFGLDIFTWDEQFNQLYIIMEYEKTPGHKILRSFGIGTVSKISKN